MLPFGTETSCCPDNAKRIEFDKDLPAALDAISARTPRDELQGGREANLPEGQETRRRIRGTFPPPGNAPRYRSMSLDIARYRSSIARYRSYRDALHGTRSVFQGDLFGGLNSGLQDGLLSRAEALAADLGKHNAGTPMPLKHDPVSVYHHGAHMPTPHPNNRPHHQVQSHLLVSLHLSYHYSALRVDARTLRACAYASSRTSRRARRTRETFPLSRGGSSIAPLAPLAPLGETNAGADAGDESERRGFARFRALRLAPPTSLSVKRNESNGRLKSPPIINYTRQLIWIHI